MKTKSLIRRMEDRVDIFKRLLGKILSGDFGAIPG